MARPHSRRRVNASRGSAERPDPPERTALELAEAAEAEAAAAEARAAAARAHATRLREQAEAKPDRSVDVDTDTDTADADSEDDGAAIDPPATRSRVPQRRRLRRPTTKTVAVTAATLLICASLALAGFFVRTDHIASRKRQRTAEFTAAARQDVTTLMSLDFNKTKEDMQRISDNSTGGFKQHFPLVALQLTHGLERSKVVTTVSVNDVAVESMTDNSAVVLVAATTQAKTTEDPQPDGQQRRQTWHIVLTLVRDKGQPKMSNVEFVQ